MSDSKLSKSSSDTTPGQERARMVAGIIGLVLVLAFVAACVLVDEGRGDGAAFVKVTKVARASQKDIVTFTAEVENTGDVTAEQVMVRGEIGDADPVDHEIDFLAPGETDEVTFTAPSGTKRSDAEVQITAWTQSS